MKWKNTLPSLSLCEMRPKGSTRLCFLSLLTPPLSTPDVCFPLGGAGGGAWGGTVGGAGEGLCMGLVRDSVFRPFKKKKKKATLGFACHPH